MYVLSTQVVVIYSPDALLIFNQSKRRCASVFGEVYLQEAIPLPLDAAAADDGLGLQIDRLHKGTIRQRILIGNQAMYAFSRGPSNWGKLNRVACAPVPTCTSVCGLAHI